MAAWDTARRNGRRVFFESETLTLRQCPENYILAVRQIGEPYSWRPDPDKASPINAHSLGIVLEQNRGLAGDALADAVEVAFWGDRQIPRHPEELVP